MLDVIWLVIRSIRGLTTYLDSDLWQKRVRSTLVTSFTELDRV